MSDAMDAMESDDVETEADEEVDRVMTEITAGTRTGTALLSPRALGDGGRLDCRARRCGAGRRPRVCAHPRRLARRGPPLIGTAVAGGGERQAS